MRASSYVGLVAVFSALIVGSDFVLSPFLNVKLLDSLVFVTSFLFGFRVGAGVAIVSETAWSYVSPWGVAGAITPFLVGGELLFALAGWWAAKVWEEKGKMLTPNALFIGALMLLCAFVWDFETNAATALIASWPSFTAQSLAAYEASGVLFAVFHEGSDFLLGTLFVPLAIVMIPRVARRWT